MANQNAWVLFALGSAFFAGLTAILGKIGVEGMNSNMATLILGQSLTLTLVIPSGLRTLRPSRQTWLSFHLLVIRLPPA